MKITLEIKGTLELAALESALEMFEAYAEEILRDPSNAPTGLTRERAKAEAQAGIDLLRRVRGDEAAR